MKYNNNLMTRMFWKFTSVILIVVYANIAHAEPEHPKNGVIVEADNLINAVDSAFNIMLTNLNEVAAGKEGSKDTFNKRFGDWLVKKSMLFCSGVDSPTNEAMLRRLLEPVSKQVPGILLPGGRPQRISESSDLEPRYCSILSLKNSKFRSMAVFFAVEKISDLGDGRYDVALVLGRFFVGDPSVGGVSPK